MRSFLSPTDEWARHASRLLRIELDDELFLHRRVGRVADDRLCRAPRLHRDDHVGPHLEARDVDPAAVHLEVPVADQLSGLCAGGREPEPVDNVVEPGLEHPQKLLAGDPRTARRLLVIAAELLLKNPVVAAGLLLLAELEQILGLLDAAAAMLARRIASALHRALLGQAPLALQEELEPFAAAVAALGAEVLAGHQCPFLWFC